MTNTIFNLNEESALFIYELKEEHKFDWKQIAAKTAEKYPKLKIEGFPFKKKNIETGQMEPSIEFSPIDGLTLFRDACSIINNNNIDLNRQVDLPETNKIDFKNLNTNKYEGMFSDKPNNIDYNFKPNSYSDLKNNNTTVDYNTIKLANENNKIFKG